MKKFNFGEYLKNVREEKKLDLEFCSNSLKIHRKFLYAIEENNYKIFDNYFQAQGFVQNYLEFLELRPSDFMPRWRGDFYNDFNHYDEKKEKFYKPKNKKIINFSLSLNKLVYGFFGLVVLGFLGFVAYQYNETLSSPVLEISKPQTNEVLEEDLVDIFGKTDSDSILRINNEKITISTDGNFSTSLKLAEGINTLRFTAVNPYGKETVRILHLIYRPRKIEIYNPPIESILEDKKTEPAAKVKTSQETEPKKEIVTSPAKETATLPSKSTNSR
jgi:cytoskeletal protein RodZ